MCALVLLAERRRQLCSICTSETGPNHLFLNCSNAAHELRVKRKKAHHERTKVSFALQVSRPLVVVVVVVPNWLQLASPNDIKSTDVFQDNDTIWLQWCAPFVRSSVCSSVRPSPCAAKVTTGGHQHEASEQNNEAKRGQQQQQPNWSFPLLHQLG